MIEFDGQPSPLEQEAADTIERLREALAMVRDADEDCKRDGLRTMPSAARSKIDQALSR